MARGRPALRALHPSGYVDRRQDAAGVLERPFTPEDLLRMVGELLRR